MEFPKFYLMKIQNSNYDDTSSFFLIDVMDVCSCNFFKMF